MDARIDKLQRISAKIEGVSCLGGGLPADDLFPRKKLAAAFLNVVSRRESGALQYGWPEGSEGLRRFIADRLVGRGAADVSADDVIVTSGGQQAIAIAAEIVGIDGRIVATEDETYPAALDLFRDRGAHPIGSEILGIPANAACAYVIDGASNPRGLGIEPARRAQLLASGVPLVVDEAYAELRFDGAAPRPLLADARDRVFHVGTFSKTLAPGLRVGWLVPPRRFVDDALRVKRDLDLQAGSMAQAVVEELLRIDDFDARLARARKAYAARASRLMDALRKYLPNVRFIEPEGAFAVFVESDLVGIDEAAALATATACGVSFDPGSMFRPGGEHEPFAFRVCYSALNSDDLEEAVRRLARAMASIEQRKAA